MRRAGRQTEIKPGSLWKVRMIGLNDASSLKEWWQTSFSLSYSVVKRMEEVVILYCCD